MKLAQLLNGIACTENLPEIEVTGVTADSRKAGPGVVFACIKGEKSDGHDFAQAAVKAGCAAVLAERPTGASVPEILVADSHEAYALCCANFFENPGAKMKLVGVTGTKGKTTITTVIKHILESQGHKTGLVGTISNMSGARVLPAHYTTPEPFELQGLLRQMADDGCAYCVMEVSSHALEQKRVAGLQFAVGIYTNLTREHLDFHKTMENYLKAKQKLFAQSDLAIINADDPYAEVILREAPCKTLRYSAKDSSADFAASEIELHSNRICYTLTGAASGKVRASLPGGFSVYNTLAALSCAVSLGISADDAIQALAKFAGVKGRIEVVPTDRDFTVIIDYAHSPDSLEKVLAAIREFARGRVIALFGCGGDRDKGKRPLMGRAAAQNADFLVVTSDNPRSEDPDAIIKDILAGLEGTSTPYTVVSNRREAIRYALTNAKKDDVVVLAGKGHEDYQILPTGTIHFDEREVIAEILAQNA